MEGNKILTETLDHFQRGPPQRCASSQDPRSGRSACYSQLPQNQSELVGCITIRVSPSPKIDNENRTVHFWKYAHNIFVPLNLNRAIITIIVILRDNIIGILLINNMAKVAEPRRMLRQ